MRSNLRCSLFLAVAACGGSSAKSPDAAPTGDTPVAVDAHPDAQVIPGCDFVENDDPTNDVTSEMTGVTYAAAPVSICGTINANHFDSTNALVDIDNYDFTVGAAGADLLVQVTGTALDAGGTIVFQISDQAQTTGFGFGQVVGTFGLVNSHVHLPAGVYTLLVESDASAAIAASHDYKVKLLPDTPATRCAKITAAADYTESHDGASNNGNDVIADDAQTGSVVTVLTTDAPEPTGLTLNPGDNKRLTGSTAGIALVAPSAYSDPDTYEITTGATTTELTFRLNWAATNADLDIGIYPEASLATGPSTIAGSFKVSSSEDEFETTAVLPNTKYLVWVGGFKTPAVTVATPYDISLCAAAYTPL
jgi:hypothetical protein